MLSVVFISFSRNMFKLLGGGGVGVDVGCLLVCKGSM